MRAALEPLPRLVPDFPDLRPSSLGAATGGGIGCVEYPKMGLPRMGGRFRGAFSSRKPGGKSSSVSLPSCSLLTSCGTIGFRLGGRCSKLL